MNRLDNWQSNLTELLESCKEKPFEWGTFDCTQFAFKSIEAVIGLDFSKPYVGKYTTAKGALKMLSKVDKVKQPLQLFEKIFGEAKSVAFARKGDIVFVDPSSVDELDVPGDINIFGPVIGVCYGQLSYFVGEQGLVTIETLKLGGCFHVLCN